MNNRALITELIFLKLDIERKINLYNQLEKELNNREFNKEENELIKNTF